MYQFLRLHLPRNLLQPVVSETLINLPQIVPFEDTEQSPC
jgi:hypothetical protein